MIDGPYRKRPPVRSGITALQVVLGIIALIILAWWIMVWLT
jgi:hypothetical protein